MRKDIEFKTQDGVTLRGWHYLPDTRVGRCPTIVMAHGYSAVKEMYLDRFADNSPVRGAQIELEIGGAKFKAEKQGEDEYEVVLPDAPKEGVLPVTATVTAGIASACSCASTRCPPRTRPRSSRLRLRARRPSLSSSSIPSPAA